MSIDDLMRPNLRKQVRELVEQILDEDGGRYRQVIVRMGTAAEDREAVLRLASAELLQRSLARSARDLLPSAMQEDEGAASRRRADEKRFGTSRKPPDVTPTQLRKRGLGAIKPLVASRPVARHVDAPTTGVIASFWTSKSALLELPRDDLAKLPDEVEGISDIYPNRHLSEPASSGALPGPGQDPAGQRRRQQINRVGNSRDRRARGLGYHQQARKGREGRPARHRGGCRAPGSQRQDRGLCGVRRQRRSEEGCRGARHG